MSGIILIFCTLGWFMIQLMFTNSFATGSLTMYNNNKTERLLDRSRRSQDGMPIILTIRIRYPSGKRVEFKLVKQPQHLANKYLPVVTPSDYPYQDIGVMEKLGDFALYQNDETCSAFIYLAKSRTLTGYIGLDYHLWKSPFEFNEDGRHLEVIGEPYLTKYPTIPPHNQPFSGTFLNPVQTTSDNPDGSSKRPLEPELEPSGKRPRIERSIGDEIYAQMANLNATEEHNIKKRSSNQRVNHFYLEILIFASRDFAELYESAFGPENYIEMLIINQMMYFNAIDRVLQPLHGLRDKLNINIAKIVIEDKAVPFDFTGNDDRLELSASFTKLREYLSNNRGIYPPDSFDHIFLFTRRAIMDGNLVIPASTQYVEDLYEDRKNGYPYNAVPITVMSPTSNYPLAVHEIARTLGIGVDPPDVGLKAIGQCSSLMQAGGSKCNRCLTWTGAQRMQYSTFIKQNRNRCILMNEPRSLRPPGPSKFVPAIKQCDCFGYDYSVKGGKPGYSIPARRCNQPLHCGKVVDGVLNIESTILPFDGAPCGVGKKVCWAGECKAIESHAC